MQMVRTIDLNIAKPVFQVHGVDAAGQVIIRRQLKRLCWYSFRSYRHAWLASKPDHRSTHVHSTINGKGTLGR